MRMIPLTLALALSGGVATSALAQDAAAAKALASKNACLACHAVDKKLVGPSYKDVAAKHKARQTRWPRCPRASSRAALACMAPCPCRRSPTSRMRKCGYSPPGSSLAPPTSKLIALFS